MKLTVEISGKKYRVDLKNPVDLSIPLRFNEVQPNFYNVPPAGAKPFEAGGFIGDTRQGGSCNVEEYRLIPHCNGTHTECVGHIAKERISLHTVLRKTLMPALLVTVTPQSQKNCPDTYLPALKKHDRIITAESLKRAVEKYPPDFLQALLIRTVPNTHEKLWRNYNREPAAFFSIEAMRLICDLKVEHLLVDLPSVDRSDDDGRMTAHHIFWDVAQDSHEVDAQKHSLKTISEMIYVPDSVADGCYLLSLQIPAFVADAAPSRPFVFPLL